MERASAPLGVPRALDPALFAAAVRSALHEAAARDDPLGAIDAAVAALHEGAEGLLPSVFVLEHGRLWLVAQRGYGVVPDGIAVEQGIMGRAVRLGRGQIVLDVHSDPDYIAALPTVTSEAAIPLRAGRAIVGVFNLDAERPLPDGTLKLARPLAAALAPLAEALRAAGGLDLPGVARLFVHLGSLRDPNEIAALSAASLARVVKVGTSQVWLWDELGSPVELASWSSDRMTSAALSTEDIEAVRTLVDPRAVFQLLDGVPRRGRRRRTGAIVWLPLRANGKELGALVGTGGGTEPVDASSLDTAAVLAAHSAASLDAAIALQRERQSAVTDALTGVLNRRGLEQRLEVEVADAQARRLPLSLIVFDCDDFKEINDRAGHEFGDALLREVADVLARSLPEDAIAARLGGDEFVVTLLGAGAEVAEALGARIRSVLAAGLTDAGFPLRLSGGISTYPFDGASPTTLLRAADQALYAAKVAGKDRIASFRQVVAREELTPTPDSVAAADERRRRPHADGSVLADALTAVRALEGEDTADGVLNRLCKALVFVVGATGCSVSRVVGNYLVDATEHALREISLGQEAAYRISDFPLTEETLRQGEPRTVSFLEHEVDSAEAFILRELGMNAMLMLPLRVHGRSWGLVELYEMRLRRFNEDDIAIAQFLAAHAERRLEVIGSREKPRRRPPVYELPPDSDEPEAPRSR
ncbi:MAG TPA: diguanylate cyclase [Gaiellaceae bacterium]|nr:diguanylate cyclase [Gaiellaceae bacterium]